MDASTDSKRVDQAELAEEQTAGTTLFETKLPKIIFDIDALHVSVNKKGELTAAPIETPEGPRFLYLPRAIAVARAGLAEIAGEKSTALWIVVDDPVTAAELEIYKIAERRTKGGHAVAIYSYSVFRLSGERKHRSFDCNQLDVPGADELFDSLAEAIAAAMAEARSSALDFDAACDDKFAPTPVSVWLVSGDPDKTPPLGHAATLTVMRIREFELDAEAG
jgi:hypothetical protein